MFQAQNRGGGGSTGGRLPTTTTSDIKITPTGTAPAAIIADKDNNEDSNSNSEELVEQNNKESIPERSVPDFKNNLGLVNVNKRRIYLRFLLHLSNENLRIDSKCKVASTVFTGE